MGGKRTRWRPLRAAAMLGGIGASVLLAGCATWTTTEKNDLLKDFDRLSRDVRTLKGPTSGGGGVREQLAELNTRLNSLEGKVAQLAGVDEDFNYRLAQFEGRVPPGMGGPPGYEPVTPGGETLEGGVPPGGVPTSPATQDPFDAGMRAYREGRYNNAVTFFETFLRENPRSPRIEEAYFYKGQAQFGDAEMTRNEKGYEGAILTFDKLRHDYPNSKFLPASLLRQGLAFKALGWPTEARVFLSDVIKRYPNSPEAAQAQKELKAL
ncbi:MAG: tol-pal system YbgF family protein [Myxococcota bacterium]